jgi:hypothetical protein
MKGRERPCSIRPQLRSSQNVLRRSVEPAANSGPSSRLSELGISVGDDTGASEAVGQSSIYASAAGSSTSRSRP